MVRGLDLLVDVLCIEVINTASLLMSFVRGFTVYRL